MKNTIESTHRTGATTDDTVKGQSFWDAKGALGGLRVDGGLANGLDLFITVEGCSCRGDVRRTTVGKRVDHGCFAVLNFNMPKTLLGLSLVAAVEKLRGREVEGGCLRERKRIVW